MKIMNWMKTILEGYKLKQWNGGSNRTGEDSMH